MIVGVLRLDLILHAPNSLKEKRSIVQKLLGRCRNRFPVSAAETGSHDLWQRCELGFVMVDVAEASIRRVFERIEDEVERSGLGEVSGSESEFLHYS